jgi:hypothetical protein
VTAVWVQYISGNNYTFSNYSHSIKTLMGLTQQQLKTASPSPRKRRAVAEAAQLCALPNTVAQFFRRPVLPRWPPAAPSVVAASRPRRPPRPTAVAPPAWDRFSAGGNAASPTRTGLHLAPVASSPAADGLAKRRVRERGGGREKRGKERVLTWHADRWGPR